MDRAKKSLGQNFLRDPNTICRIVEFGCVHPEEPLMEIGPGRGALTRRLLQLSDDLIAVELDAGIARSWLVPLFEKFPRARLCIQDIRTFDPRAISDFGRRKCFGNLPYNIATHLVLKYAEPGWRPFFSQMIFMVQNEVACRIWAEPGSKNYGYLSCVCQLAYEIERGFLVRPAAFSPRPKVDSRVLRLIPVADWPYDAKLWALLKQLLKRSFTQRRKTIYNNLKGLHFAPLLLEEAEISRTSRAEEIPIVKYIKLARAYLRLSGIESRQSQV
ncbi:MAG: ribosomal RNA small subunit methyltransferase A [Acidobacteria bacterium]|nr:ribosomal RNA small subunit methyltransferase A [Acidobacteriota bacterium]